ncbi:MAG TPA: 1-(5-phosphoribosyl)-5-[(5-phosphoribosylamino)methylideneamino]imidazole-4-carboxamide isomerase [Thermomicrobiales bacterium]|nr:1-(5-phosphoribosyl)-5-[(5-phosphoribosylamino)methylideneamino]imidazole-4-carboxamide isomerase [Thermomicrobiales bacterium]
MIIFPAIDIRGGQCVRLVEGDFSRETIFDPDPVDAAKRWVDAGATHIHIVDLDGARDGIGANREAILRIRKTTGAFLQVGGGIRGLAQAGQLIDAGIDRIVLGSLLVHKPAEAIEIGRTFPGQVAAGLDARNGKLATAGWREQTEIDAFVMAASLVQDGITTVIYTDIARDGTLEGPNLPSLQQMIAIPGLSVVASGGIGAIDDVAQVAAIGADAVIIGRALYDQRVDLREALTWQ